MDCQTVSERLDDRLDTDAYTTADASANGLQIGPADQPVERAAFAVDAAVETITEAVRRNADLLVTHHGVSWGGIERVTGTQYDRISAAIKNDLALYTAHLPLDGHQELGNAARLGALLGLEETQPFGTYSGEYVGQCGQTPEPRGLDELQATLSDALDTGGSGVRVLDFGPSDIQTVAIVTGSGVDWLQEAADIGADVLLTGEGKQHAYHEAQELGINVVLAGHYATETVGVRALQELVGGWGIETTFIDCPTGL